MLSLEAPAILLQRSMGPIHQGPGQIGRDRNRYPFPLRPHARSAALPVAPPPFPGGSASVLRPVFLDLTTVSYIARWDLAGPPLPESPSTRSLGRYVAGRHRLL